MRTILLILSLSVIISVQGQIEGYKITKSDTIKLRDISFKRVAAFHLSEATILIDYDLFMKHLTETRNGLKKQIRSRERMIRRGKDNHLITLAQLKFYKRDFKIVDSVFNATRQNKMDTFYVDYFRTPIVNFIPSAIESNQSIVLDRNNHKQIFIIKMSGNIKTGEMTAVGSSFYFIPGATKYFLSKRDWVS